VYLYDGMMMMMMLW